jgi:hypothetical protein
MRRNIPPAGDEKQAIDLAGCSLAPIQGTRIALVIPSPEAELRLSVQLSIPYRFKAIRADALRNLEPDTEAFGQRNFALGQHLYLSISLLTTHRQWRGGWLLFACPPGEEEKLVEYLHAGRDAVVANLRKERRQHGSAN